MNKVWLNVKKAWPEISLGVAVVVIIGGAAALGASAPIEKPVPPATVTVTVQAPAHTELAPATSEAPVLPPAAKAPAAPVEKASPKAVPQQAPKKAPSKAKAAPKPAPRVQTPAPPVGPQPTGTEPSPGGGWQLPPCYDPSCVASG